MPSITPMISAMRCDDAAISTIVATTCRTSAPPRAAASEASTARRCASTAVCALVCTVMVSSSIDAAVCWRLLACSSVRWLRSALPVAICVEPVATLSLLVRTCSTTSARRSRIARIAARMLRPSVSRTGIPTARSPSAIALATRMASSGSPPTARVTLRVSALAMTAPMSVAAVARPASQAPAVSAVSRAAVAVARICCFWSSTSLFTAPKKTSCAGRTASKSKAVASAACPSRTRRCILSMAAA